jgi:hypothetical protein
MKSRSTPIRIADWFHRIKATDAWQKLLALRASAAA